jgi:hypothetical protein
MPHSSKFKEPRPKDYAGYKEWYRLSRYRNRIKKELTSMENGSMTQPLHLFKHKKEIV